MEKIKWKTFLDQSATALFVILTVCLSFGAYLLPLPRTAVPFVMVLVPSVVALILTGLASGRRGIGALLGGFRRGAGFLKWSAITILLALGLRLAMSGLGIAMGWLDALGLRAWTATQFAFFAVILYLAAIFEEIGWRGFALPRMLQRYPAWLSGVALGLPWGFLHLALTLPGMENQGQPWLPLVLELTGLSVLITWVFIRSQGSLAITSLLHAAQSFFVIVNDGLTIGQQFWLMAIVYLSAGLIVILLDPGMGVRSRKMVPVEPETSL